MFNTPKRAILEIQTGGSGQSAWAPVAHVNDVTQTKMAAVSGGDTEYTDVYGRDYRNGGELIIADTIKTGQPKPYTFDLSLPLQLRRTIAALLGKKNLRVRFYTGEPSVPTNYQKILHYAAAYNTSKKFNRSMVNNTDNEKDPLGRDIGQRASAEVEIDPIVHNILTNAVTSNAIMQVKSVGFYREATGAIGETLNNDGLQEYVAMTAKNTGTNNPDLLYSTNKGVTWTKTTLTTFTNFDGMGICKAGPNLVLAGKGTAGGALYINYADLKSGATSAPTRSSGISAGTAINAIIAVTNSIVYAVGAAGAVYKSTDSGMSFTSLGTAVTANALNCIAAADESLLWAGGASGTLVRIYNGIMSTTTVTGISTNAVNSVAVPRGRGMEVYLGAADGKVYKSVDMGVTWTNPTFDQSGSGSIDALEFAGYDGAILYVAQTNGSTQSRILRDLSGGYLGLDCEVIGTFTSPTNATFNSLAAADHNTVMIVGDIVSSQGFISLLA